MPASFLFIQLSFLGRCETSIYILPSFKRLALVCLVKDRGDESLERRVHQGLKYEVPRWLKLAWSTWWKRVKGESPRIYYSKTRADWSTYRWNSCSRLQRRELEIFEQVPFVNCLACWLATWAKSIRWIDLTRNTRLKKKKKIFNYW